MIIIRQSLFSKKKNKEKEEDKNDLRKVGALTAGLTGAGILGTTKTGRLTGKVTRYHDTEIGNVKDILENGIKSKYSTDPENLTNTVLKDVDMKDKEGLVYTAKKKSDALGIGATRATYKKHGAKNINLDLEARNNYLRERYLPSKRSHKALKLEFDYDELKNSPRIANPELRGAKTWQEFRDKISGPLDFRPQAQKDMEAKELFRTLGEDTHVFRGDIDPSHIVGGKGHKRRSLKQIKNYIKNNPKRFAKEAAKVGAGAAVLGAGVGLGMKAYKKDKELKKEGSKK